MKHGTPEFCDGLNAVLTTVLGGPNGNDPIQGIPCGLPTLVLDMDDLESITHTMRKVEAFLHEVGFTYVSLSKAAPMDNSKWQYDVSGPHLNVH